MKLYLIFVFLPFITIGQTNDYIFFETPSPINGWEHYCLPVSNSSTDSINLILNPNSRNTEMGSKLGHYRFWIVKNNVFTEYFEYLDSNSFNLDSLIDKATNIQYRYLTISHQQKENTSDSLRVLNIPFYYKAPSPHLKWMVEVECYFKPIEISPWDEETFFWFTDVTDSLRNIIEEAYPNLDLESMEMVAASGPYQKGSYFKLKIFLDNQYWSRAPLWKSGFYIINQNTVVPRTYKMKFAKPKE
jgi:hypothetical protein